MNDSEKDCIRSAQSTGHRKRPRTAIELVRSRAFRIQFVELSWVAMGIQLIVDVLAHNRYQQFGFLSSWYALHDLFFSSVSCWRGAMVILPIAFTAAVRASARGWIESSLVTTGTAALHIGSASAVDVTALRVESQGVIAINTGHRLYLSCSARIRSCGRALTETFKNIIPRPFTLI